MAFYETSLLILHSLFFLNDGISFSACVWREECSLPINMFLRKSEICLTEHVIMLQFPQMMGLQWFFSKAHC